MSVLMFLSATMAIGQNVKGQAAQPPWLVQSRRLQQASANPTQDRARTALTRYTVPPATTWPEIMKISEQVTRN
jgi:hypothetical protein